MTTAPTLGERIKLARQRRGFSQKALADKCEPRLSDGYISMLEREGGKNSIQSPGLDGLKSIAHALDVPESWLILGLGDEPDWGQVLPAAEGAE